MQGWYFSDKSRCLRYGDGRAITLYQKHVVEGPLAFCERGLHASECAFDALSYAPGPVLWRVELSGDILQGDDKACATERAYIAGGIDITDALCAFARRCALDVIHLWDAPRAVKQYLETGDTELRNAAWDAAWNAKNAAWAAARAARAAGNAARATQRKTFNEMCEAAIAGAV